MEVPETLKEEIYEIICKLIFEFLYQIDCKEEPTMTNEDWFSSNEREILLSNEALNSSWEWIESYIKKELKEGGSLFIKNKSFLKRMEIPIHQYAEEVWKTEVLDTTKEYINNTSS